MRLSLVVFLMTSFTLGACQYSSGSYDCHNVTMKDVCGDSGHYIAQATQCAGAVITGFFNYMYCGDGSNCPHQTESIIVSSSYYTVNATCSTDGVHYNTYNGYVGLMNSVLGTYTEAKICGSYMSAFSACMDKAFIGCSSSFKTNLITYKQRFTDNICSNGQMQTYLAPIKGNFVNAYTSLYTSTGPCSISSLESIYTSGANGSDCYSELYKVTSLSFYGGSTNVTSTSFDVLEPTLSKIMRGVMNCFVAGISEAGCDNTLFGGVQTAYVHIVSVPVGLDVPLKPLLDKINATVNPFESRRFTTVVFGDPHITYYDQGSQNAVFETCAALGLQKYLENKYVSIHGQNTYPNAAFTTATYMTAVDIKFYKDQTVVGTYVAGSGAIPTAFDSNTVTSVLTITKKSDSRVLLQYSDAGIVISLDKRNGIYMMAVRQAETLYTKSSGILVSGCPEVAVDVTSDPSVSGRKRRATADTVCANVDATYQNSCKFDYQATGDEGLAKAASEVMPAMQSETEAQDSSIVKESVASGHQASVVIMLIMAAGIWICH